ncbi:hypothetical protein GJ496_003062 [Pomphorhynchus laevis]|nr:hypothetical protein GJ496_003062 [Pomphorhynchus laevis]
MKPRHRRNMSYHHNSQQHRSGKTTATSSIVPVGGGASVTDKPEYRKNRRQRSGNSRIKHSHSASTSSDHIGTVRSTRKSPQQLSLLSSSLVDKNSSYNSTSSGLNNRLDTPNTSNNSSANLNNSRMRNQGSYYANSNTAFFQKFQENYKKQINGERGNQLYQSAFPLKHIPEKLNFSYRLLGRNIFNKTSTSPATAGNVSDGSASGRNDRGRTMRHNRRIEKRFKNYMRFQAQQGAIPDLVPNATSSNNRSPSRYKEESTSPTGFKRKKRPNITSPTNNSSISLKDSNSYSSFTGGGSRIDKRRRLHASSSTGGGIVTDNTSQLNRRSKCNSSAHSSIEITTTGGQPASYSLSTTGLTSSSAASASLTLNRKSKNGRKSIGNISSRSGYCGASDGRSNLLDKHQRHSLSQKNSSSRRTNCNKDSTYSKRGGDRFQRGGIVESDHQQQYHNRRRHSHHQHNHDQRRSVGGSVGDDQLDRSCSISSYSSSDELSYSQSISQSNSSFDSPSSAYHSSMNSDSMSHSYISSESSFITSDASMEYNEIGDNIALNSGAGISATCGNISTGAGYHSVRENKLRTGRIYRNTDCKLNDMTNASADVDSSHYSDDMSDEEDSQFSISTHQQKKMNTTSFAGDVANAARKTENGGKDVNKSINNSIVDGYSGKARKSLRNFNKSVEHGGRKKNKYNCRDSKLAMLSKSPSPTSTGNGHVDNKKTRYRIKAADSMRNRKKLNRGALVVNSNKLSPDRSSMYRHNAYNKHYRKHILSGDHENNYSGRGNSSNLGEKSSRRRHKHKEEDYSADSDSSQMDISKQLYPIRHYISNREEMLMQMFASIRGRKLNAMLPDILKNRDFEEVKARCLDQLECMSKKRILCTLIDKDMTSSSGTEDSNDEDTDMKDESKLQQTTIIAESQIIKKINVNPAFNQFKPNKMRPLCSLPDQSMEDFTERIAAVNSIKQRSTIESSTIRSMRMAEDANVRAAAVAALQQRKASMQQHSADAANNVSSYSGSSTKARCVHAADDFENYYEEFKKVKHASHAACARNKSSLSDHYYPYSNSQTPLSPDASDAASISTTLKQHDTRFHRFHRRSDSRSTIVGHSRIICSECEQSYSSSDVPSPSSFDSECSACDTRKQSKTVHISNNCLNDKMGSLGNSIRKSSLVSSGDEQIESKSRIKRWVDTLIMTDVEDECILVQSELDFLTDQLRNRSSSPAREAAASTDQTNTVDNNTIPAENVVYHETDRHDDSDIDDHQYNLTFSDSGADDEESDVDSISLAENATSELWDNFKQLDLEAAVSPDSAIASDHSSTDPICTQSRIGEYCKVNKKTMMRKSMEHCTRQLRQFYASRHHHSQNRFLLSSSLTHQNSYMITHANYKYDMAKQVNLLPSSSKRIRESLELWLLERQAKVLKAALQREKTLPIDDYFKTYGANANAKYGDGNNKSVSVAAEDDDRNLAAAKESTEGGCSLHSDISDTMQSMCHQIVEKLEIR